MKKSKVFLSHSSEDKAFALRLADLLRKNDLEVWIDEAEINVGDSLILKISDVIKEVDFVVAILSNNSVRSNWVQKELALAMTKEIEEKKVVVLPILMEPCLIPTFLKDKFFADFTDPKTFDEQFSKLLATLNAENLTVYADQKQPHKKKIQETIGQKIQFCTTHDGVKIAYAITGSGYPIVKAANWLSHLSYEYNSPIWRHWIKGLSRNNLLIRYDERGCGLSERNVGDPSFLLWLSDLETVVESLKLNRFALLGISQGAAVAIAYTVRHTEKVSHLILYGGFAKGWAKSDNLEYVEECRPLVNSTKSWWGSDNPAIRQMFTTTIIPDASTEDHECFNELQKKSTSPENAYKSIVEFGEIDIIDLLPKVNVPTLILHRSDDRLVLFEEGRNLATQIPGADLVTLEGRNHIILENESAWDQFLTAVLNFLEGRD